MNLPFSSPAPGQRPQASSRPGRISTRQKFRERPPTQRFPIAAKYSLVTAVLLITFLVWVGSASYEVSVEATTQQIDRSGIQMAVLVARSVHPFWEDENLPDGEKLLAQSELETRLRSFVADPGSKGVLDVLVLDASGNRFIASALSGDKIRLQSQRTLSIDLAKESGVKVQTGTLSSGGQAQPVRSYQRSILQEGTIRGTVRVFLSAVGIERLEKNLSNMTIGTVLAALLVGLPLALFVGFFLTRPVRALKQDMAVVAHGDLSHQSSVRTSDELGMLAHAFNRMTQHLSEAQEREVERQALERELSIANRIQSALLPEKLPEIEGLEMACHYLPAKEVGGDYYDVIPLAGGKYGVVVADVSGKGIPGSLVMTMTRGLVRMAARTQADVQSLLTVVNASLSRDMTRGMFVTLAYAEFDPDVGQVAMARAGHNPPLLVQGGQVGALQPDGIALGIDPGDLFSNTLRIQRLNLAAGDVLVLYTDGVIEAMDPQGNEYTTARFVEVLKGTAGLDPQSIVDAVLEDLRLHVRGAEPSDDVSLLVIRRS